MKNNLKKQGTGASFYLQYLKEKKMMNKAILDIQIKDVHFFVMNSFVDENIIYYSKEATYSYHFLFSEIEQDNLKDISIILLLDNEYINFFEEEEISLLYYISELTDQDKLLFRVTDISFKENHVIISLTSNINEDHFIFLKDEIKNFDLSIPSQRIVDSRERHKLLIQSIKEQQDKESIDSSIASNIALITLIVACILTFTFCIIKYYFLAICIFIFGVVFSIFFRGFHVYKIKSMFSKSKR